MILRETEKSCSKWKKYSIVLCCVYENFKVTAETRATLVSNLIANYERKKQEEKNESAIAE
jgi:hypothetical protein